MIQQTSPPWQITLFGGLKVSTGNSSESITRFRSQRYAALLAYLVLHPSRQHAREELADMLWPDAETEAARTNLRTALASLRRQLETHSAGDGADVIRAIGRTHLQIVAEAVVTDVSRFERALLRAKQSGNTPEETESLLREAIKSYGGPLLPGFYEPWALTERDRLAEAYQGALLQLAEHQERGGNVRGACETALLAVAADPLREESRALLIRQYRRLGDNASARRQYREIERLLDAQYGATPSHLLQSALRDPLPTGSTPPGRAETPEEAYSAGRNPPTADKTVAGAAGAAGTAVVPPPAAAPANAAVQEKAESRTVQLPLLLSRFFGREGELAALSDLLQSAETRLVTLTGTGGSGKTRLAIEAAKRQETQSFPGGIRFVPLADLRSADRIPEAIAHALGLPASAAQASLQEQVISALQSLGSRFLLVLDNLEQLVEIGAALLLRTFLERIPCLVILATSRQSLGVEGERELQVDPLPVPTLAGVPDRLLEFPSIQLFVNRAQASRPDFPFNARNADAVATLCTRLEGIPLAIELAAAWSQTLTPAQMLQRMNSGPTLSFDLLASRRRDIAPRHATLRSAITWSYDLLAPDSRRFFATLSVFRGGWTLAAAEAVAGEPTAAMLLAELQERSLLLSQEQEDGTMRYRLLEPLREFADEQLAGEVRTAAFRRHADYFLSLAEEAEPHLTTGEQIAWIRRLSPEMENFRAILLRATDPENGGPDPLVGLSLAGAIARFWDARGDAREGVDLFGRLLTLAEAAEEAKSPSSQSSRAKVLRCTGGLLCYLGEYENAHRYQQQALALYQALGNDTEAARTYMNLGNTGYYRGDLQYARDSYERGLVTARRENDESLTARILSNMAMVVHNQGDLDAALLLYKEGLETCRRIHDEPGTANALLNLGTLYIYREQFDEAKALFEECCTLSQTIGHRSLYVRSIHNLGVVARDQGDTDTAQSLLDESLRLCQEAEDKYGLGAVWEDLALLAETQGDFAEAASRFALSLKMRQENGERILVVFTLQNMGLLAAQQKKTREAVRLLGTANAFCESLGSPLPPQQQRRQDAIVAELTTALGEKEFGRLWSEGGALSLEEAVNIALHPLEHPPA